MVAINSAYLPVCELHWKVNHETQENKIWLGRRQEAGVRIQEVELRNQKWMWGPEYKRIKKFNLQSRRWRYLGEA